VRKVHGALVWLIEDFARDITQHGETTSDDCAFGASERKEIGFGDLRVKVVCREWATGYQDVNLMSILLKLDWFILAKGKDASRAECQQ
jgi:hypothetical protein